MWIMTKNYVYRMDHDTGSAPRIENDTFCFLSGCKMNTIESWAQKGGWVMGIGGNGTHKPDKLIYAMKVDRNIIMPKFLKKFPEFSNHLINKDAPNVLVAKEFYYLGDKAVQLPIELSHLVIHTQGCKSTAFTGNNVKVLRAFLNKKGIKPGKSGNPNNPASNNDISCTQKLCQHKALNLNR